MYSRRNALEKKKLAAADEQDEGRPRTITQLIKDLIILPIRIAISLPARRAYLTTFLLLLASSFLALISILTYALFYYTYIPSPSFTLPIHLQFPDSPAAYPYAILPLTSPSLSSNQPYDVAVTLALPRTKSNIALGNFMLDLNLLSTSTPTYANPLAPYNDNLTRYLSSPQTTTIASSRRPASLTYRSPLLDLTHKFVFSPLYLINFFTESENLHVSLMESATFSRGRVPKAMSLELQTQLLGAGGAAQARRARLQVYWAQVTFTARLEGLRWWMYKHRVLSFVVCTGMFWAVEMAVAVSVWAGVSFVYWRRRRTDDGKKRVEGDHFKMEEREGLEGLVKIKKEEEEDEREGLSDTSRSFPTFTRQPPLRYSGTAAMKIKKEEDEDEDRADEQTLPAVPTAAEGDVEDEDEDEDADFVLEQRFERLGDAVGMQGGRGFDSGIGSSMDSGSGRPRADLRRRTSRGDKVKD